MIAMALLRQRLPNPNRQASLAKYIAGQQARQAREDRHHKTRGTAHCSRGAAAFVSPAPGLQYARFWRGGVEDVSAGNSPARDGAPAHTASPARNWYRDPCSCDAKHK